MPAVNAPMQAMTSPTNTATRACRRFPRPSAQARRHGRCRSKQPLPQPQWKPQATTWQQSPAVLQTHDADANVQSILWSSVSIPRITSVNEYGGGCGRGFVRTWAAVLAKPADVWRTVNKSLKSAMFPRTWPRRHTEDYNQTRGHAVGGIMKLLTGLVGRVLIRFAFAFADSAAAQSGYPDKPIKIVVGFSPGVAPDMTSRLFADKFNETWAKGVVVENVTGAGGNLAVGAHGQGRAGRLQPGDGRQRRGGDQSEPDRQARLRPAQGFHLHHPGLHRAEHHGGDAGRAGQDRPGGDRARQARSRIISSPATPASAPRSISPASCS